MKISRMRSCMPICGMLPFCIHFCSSTLKNIRRYMSLYLICPYFIYFFLRIFTYLRGYAHAFRMLSGCNPHSSTIDLPEMAIKCRRCRPGSSAHGYFLVHAGSRTLFWAHFFFLAETVWKYIINCGKVNPGRDRIYSARHLPQSPGWWQTRRSLLIR